MGSVGVPGRAEVATGQFRLRSPSAPQEFEGANGGGEGRPTGTSAEPLGSPPSDRGGFSCPRPGEIRLAASARIPGENSRNPYGVGGHSELTMDNWIYPAGPAVPEPFSLAPAMNEAERLTRSPWCIAAQAPGTDSFTMQSDARVDSGPLTDVREAGIRSLPVAHAIRVPQPR